MSTVQIPRSDLWLLSHFPEDYKGYAVEVGAAHGDGTSPTKLLEEKGWTVLCVEPNPDLAQRCREVRPLSMTIQCACGSADQATADFWINKENPEAASSLRKDNFHPRWHPKKDYEQDVITVGVKTLTSLLTLLEYPRLDILSVDTEGTELDVLKGLDWDRWKPTALCIESWDWPSDLMEFLEPKGYVMKHRWLVDNLICLETDETEGV